MIRIAAVETTCGAVIATAGALIAGIGGEIALVSGAALVFLGATGVGHGLLLGLGLIDLPPEAQPDERERRTQEPAHARIQRKHHHGPQ